MNFNKTTIIKIMMSAPPPTTPNPSTEPAPTQTNETNEQLDQQRDQEIKSSVGVEPQIYKGKKVLKQDQPQRQQAERKYREKSIKAYNQWVQDYNIEAERLYQKDVAQFQKEKAEYEKQQAEFDKRLKEYDQAITKYELEKAQRDKKLTELFGSIEKGEQEVQRYKTFQTEIDRLKAIQTQKETQYQEGKKIAESKSLQYKTYQLSKEEKEEIARLERGIQDEYANPTLYGAVNIKGALERIQALKSLEGLKIPEPTQDEYFTPKERRAMEQLEITLIKANLPETDPRVKAYSKFAREKAKAQQKEQSVKPVMFGNKPLLQVAAIHLYTKEKPVTEKSIKETARSIQSQLTQVEESFKIHQDSKRAQEQRNKIFDVYANNLTEAEIKARAEYDKEQSRISRELAQKIKNQEIVKQKQIEQAGLAVHEGFKEIQEKKELLQSGKKILKQYSEFASKTGFHTTKPKKPSPSFIAVTNFLQQYKTTAKPPKTVLEGVVYQKGLQLKPDAQKLIADVTAPEKPPEITTRSALITDPKTGRTFDTKKGFGDPKIGLALGIQYNYNYPQPQTQLAYQVTKPETIQFSKLTYSELVDKGITKPSKPVDYLRYYLSRGQRPITNLLDYTGIGGQYRKDAIVPTTSERLFINIEESIKGIKPFEQGFKETAQSVKKDPLGLVAEVPAETALWITAGKGIGLASKGIEKMIAPIQRYIKPKPVIDPKTGKIYPKRQQQLTPELVNQPIAKYTNLNMMREPIPKDIFKFDTARYGFYEKYLKLGKAQAKTKPKPIGKKETPVKPDPTYKPTTRPKSEIDFEGTFPKEKIIGEIKLSKDFIPSKPKKPIGKIEEPAKPVKLDPTYKPTTRPKSEIDFEGTFPKEKIIGEIKLSKDFIPSKPKKPIGKIEEPAKPVKLDPTYKPPTRANELSDVFKSDDVLTTFSTKKVRLGKGQTPKQPDKPIGKKETPVKQDPYYTPARRSNEIDLSLDDAFSGFRAMQLKLGKATISKTQPRPKTVKPSKKYKPSTDIDEIKRRVARDTARYGITETRTGLGSGGLISGSKSGQRTVQIKKTKRTQKYKQLTQSKMPMPVDWTTKETFRTLPKTGKAPLTLSIVKKKKKKKQDYGVAYGYAPVQVQPETSYGITKARQPPKEEAITRPVIQSKTTLKQEIKIQTKPASRIKLVSQSVGISIKPKQKQKLRLKTPTKPSRPTRPRTTVMAKPTFRSRARQKIAFVPEIIPPKTPTIPDAAQPPKKKPKQKPTKKKKQKTVEFIGNVQLTKVEGMYGRPTLIYGKKAGKLAKKQLKKETKQPKVRII